jgi:hypothetical protein
MNYRVLIALFATSLTCATAATLTYSDTTVGGPSWQRPHSGIPPTWVTSSTGYAFHVLSFVVDTSGSYNLVTTAASFDNYLILYRDAFNPAAPLTNALAADDDSGTGLNSAIYNFALSSGVDYYLVTSSFSRTDSGTFTNQLSGPGNIAAPEPATILLTLAGLAGVLVLRKR